MRKKTRRNLILKARQEGLSKIIDADQLIDCVKRPTNAVVISHETEATKRLFAAVRGFIETMEIQPTTSIYSKSEIQFPTIPSSYFIGTAGQKAFGRGDTVHRAHLSEAAFYDNLDRIRGGIEEAAELGQIDIETTPNGREQFYDLWQKAKKGKSSYTNIFIPWFINREYNIDNLTEKERTGLSASVQEIFDMPDDEFIASMDQQEKDLVARVAKEYGIMLTPGEMKWRRYKIWDKEDLFFQEYPEDDVSCFLQTGRSVFKHITTDTSVQIPLDSIEEMRTEDRDRLLGNKEKGIKRKLLYAGLDPAEGTEHGDAHAFAVMEPSKDKARVIFEYVSNEPIDVFAAKVAVVMDRFYISLGVEKIGVGLAMCRKLAELDVPFEEYNTSATNRSPMLLELEEAYRKKDLIEGYPQAENEARDMLFDERNRPVHPAGKHDDRVFARAIALQISKEPVPSFSNW